MPRKRYQPHIQTNHEFDLDLAPLLAVMVKLVPVLLISSAFVQVMMIETQLPQAVVEAIKNQENDPEKAQIKLVAQAKGEILIEITQLGKTTTQKINAINSGEYNFEELQIALQKVKATYPKVFHLELRPESNVAYKNIVKIMDEARKSRSNDIRFPIWDAQKNIETETDYMFPDITFDSIAEG